MIIRTQNRVAQSRWTLSFTAVYAALACLAAGVLTRQLWIQPLLLAVSTLMLIEFNNANSLIRIYSRMVSSSFLVMMTMSAFLLPSTEVAVTQMAFILFYLYFFKAYQDPTSAGWVFYAFMGIGIASITFVQILFFVPVLWILLATNVLAFSARTFFASILGIIAPYWFVGGYYAYMNDLDYFRRHLLELLQLAPAFNMGILDEHRIITGCFILLLAVLGSVHFLIYSYQDKIRTRMMYETFITLAACSIAFTALQPRHFDKLLGMTIVTTAPLIGHYLALSHSKISNICFFVIIALALTITAYNLWMPSPIFS